MEETSKKKYLEDASNHVSAVRARVLKEIEKTRVGISTKMGAAKIEDRWTNDAVKAMREDRLSQLELMESSPYFNKCSCTFEGKEKDYYFGKFTLPEANIYSWVVPAATMRFENPGEVSYRLPGNRIRKGKMNEKDQYMIVDGKILFYTKETEGQGRQLIHQEHFSSRKSGFVLPEIVSVMEKAQDMIIRAHHQGPFAISGPAGSGKTTLALHRAAYLIQSPDTAELYPSEKAVVFVQDTGTKEYFSTLLPELGINHVEITTFFEWASKILPLEGMTLVPEINPEEQSASLNSYNKIQTLRTKQIPKWSTNVISLLEDYFGDSFSGQRKQKILDRIDVTLLLQSFLNSKKRFETVRRFTRASHEGKLVKRSEKKILNYSLMIIDEFQNYMPEQIKLLLSCIDEDTRSAIYVGDMAQQVRLGTIRSWEDIGESLSSERNVMLHKVYRNTRQILNYIRTVGYKVEIPEGIKEGPEVMEIEAKNREEIIENVRTAITRKQKSETIGIICKEKETAEFLKGHFKEEGVHICTMIESQGVEFDRVCLIIPDANKPTDSSAPQSFIEEISKIEKDLLYVALTRAIQEMTVIRHK